MNLDYDLKQEIKNAFNDLKSPKTFKKQIPNLLTFSRASLSPISSILFLTGHSVIGVIFTGLLLSTDLFDGKLARKWNVQSSFGADLDAFSDKIMFLWLSLPLIVSNPIVLLNFAFEGAISGVNVVGRMKGLNTKTVFSGKVKTCLLSTMLIFGYLVQFLNLPVSILNTLVGLTFVSQSVAFANYISEYKRMSKEQVEIVKLNYKLIEEDIENEKTNIKKETLVESLRKEKNFVLGFNEPDREYEPNKKTKNKKKNDNFTN